jgi:predicted alpha/beta-hydrolase family hydrolase
VPVLCFNGTRDALCRRDLMEKALEKLSWQMHWLEGAGHSFRARDYKEIAEVSRDWLSRLA